MLRNLSIIILYVLVLSTLGMVIYLLVTYKQKDKLDPVYMLATDNDKALPNLTSPSVVSVLEEMGISCENNSVSFTVPVKATSVSASGPISSNTTVSAPTVNGTSSVTGGTLNFNDMLNGKAGAVATIDGIICNSITNKNMPVKPGASFNGLYVSGQSGLNGITATDVSLQQLNGTSVAWCGNGIGNDAGEYLHGGPC